jgi:predicted nucleic acid-binding protein
VRLAFDLATGRRGTSERFRVTLRKPIHFIKRSLGEYKAISTITWMEVLVGTTTDHEPAICAWLGSFDVIVLDTEIANRAVEIRKHKRIGLPDAIVWASTEVNSLLLVSRNTKDFVRMNAACACRTNSKRPFQKDCSVRLKMFQQTREQPSLRNAS